MHKQNNSFNRAAVAGLLTLTLLSSVPVNASAQTPTVPDLQTRIQELLAQITALQSGTGYTLAPYQWSTPFGIGATGEQVRELQRLLNNDPDTRIAASGVGSKGNETTYYGPATAAAVSKFQMKYRSEILTPSGLVNPTGYFGLATLNKANQLRKAVVTPPSPTNPNPTTPTTPKPTTPDTIELKGEGELDEVELDEADDTDIEEAAADAPAAVVTFSADNGDIRITRLDLALVADSANGERDPWDVFEDVSIWVDGKKIAEKNIDRKADFQDDRQGTIRLTGLDLVVEEDEDVEMTIALTLQNNVDGAGSDANWNVRLNALRYFDGEGVSTDERSTGDLGNSVAFSIVERGDGEELKFSLHRNSPDASTIIVDDSKRTNNVTILEYEIEAIDNDIELETLAVNIETGPAAYSDTVNDVRLVINGRSFRSDEIVTTGNYSTTSVLARFDIDKKVTINKDDIESIKVVVDLKSAAGYQNGQTITARITSPEREMTEAEGSDDIREFSGTVVGEEHRLIAEGIDTPIDTVRFSTRTQGKNDTTGIFTITFDVSAVEGDFYIRDFASTTVDGGTGGVGYVVDGGTDFETLSATLSSTADESSSAFVVREGRTETFTLSVTIDPTAAGQFRVALTNIISSDNGDGVTGSQTYTINPINRYRTPYQFINN